MNKILLGLIFVLSYLDMYAQEFKRNYQLTAGYQPPSKINFNNSIIKIDSTIKDYAITSSSSCISDTTGNFLFVSNGFQIFDKQGLIKNGDKINCPKGTILYYAYYQSPFYQSTLVLPKKGNEYYIFNVGMSDSQANKYLGFIETRWDILSYCVVNMDSNNNKGKVIIKDRIIDSTQKYKSVEFTAIQHGNGQDWWLIKPDANNTRFIKYQITPDTILGPYFQNITDTGNFVFTGNFIIPNKQGTKLAWGGVGNIEVDANNDSLYNFNRVDLFDFDRCTGLMSNQHYYKTPFNISTYPNKDFKTGACFSEDGNLLYISNFYTIYQIDINDTAINNSILITTPDTLINYFPWWAHMSLGPNGKIYIGNGNGTNKAMCYIDSSNIRGVGCAFRGRGNGALQSPFGNITSPSANAFFGLGVMSGCTPASIENEQLTIDTG
jgi:hypothetical protein